MFKEEYIIELISGRLTQKGYANIVSSVALMARRFNWQKDIVVSESFGTYWNDDDVKELTQQFFEWIITNGKLDYINKVPHEYLSYYFTQMLVSFVSNRIKEEQQKVGISFQKCNALVREIADEYYKPVSHMDKSYVKSNLASGNVWINNLEDAVKYLSHYPITEETKQYKPIVKLAVEEVLIAADAYVSIDSLVNAVYGLFDQSSFSVNVDESETENSYDGKYDSAIAKILEGIDSTDAHIFLNYVFGDEQKMSLSEIAIKYNVPKSSVHKKIEDFKNKIFKVYMPENEDDGICFLQNLAQSLDDLAK
jgi:hypothetical protein